MHLRCVCMRSWSDAFHPFRRPKRYKNDDDDDLPPSPVVRSCKKHPKTTATIYPAEELPFVVLPPTKVKPSNRCRALILSPLRLVDIFAKRKRLYRKTKKKAQQSNRRPGQGDEDQQTPTTTTTSTCERESSCLGQGGFGAVYRHTYNDRDVAIKQLHFRRHSSASHFQSFRSELNAFRLLPSPYIVQPLTFTSSSQVVTEFIEGKNLRQLIDDDKWNANIWERLRLAVHVISALVHCHNHSLLHLDVKPANIIVDLHEKRCKLTDFGCSRTAELANGLDVLVAKGGENKSSDGCFGTIAYKAPELFKRGEKVTDRADVYSFSLVLWELLAQKDAFGGDIHPHALVYRVVVHGLRPNIDHAMRKVPTGACQEALIAMLGNCWSARVMERPCAANVRHQLQRIIHSSKNE